MLNNHTKNTHKFPCTKLQWKSIVRQSSISVKFYFESHILVSTELTCDRASFFFATGRNLPAAKTRGRLIAGYNRV